MADRDTLAALFSGMNGSSGSSRGNYDLDQFDKILNQNNLWNMAAAPVMQAKFDNSTWSPGTTLGVSAAQSFLGALLGGMGNRQNAAQYEKLNEVLPKLYQDPSSVTLPEGMDAEAFGTLKSNALRENAARSIGKDDRKESRKESLFAEMFTRNPELAIQVMPDVAKNLDISLPERKTEPAPAIEEVPQGPSLADGRQSTIDKQKKYFKELLAQGYTSAQASETARKQVEGEIKSNTKSYDEARQAREYGQRLLDLSNTAKAGIAEAGKTGSFNSFANMYENVANLFGSEEAAKNLRGDTNIESIAPELVKMGRSPGAVSDYEASMLLKSGPSTKNTPESNIMLAQKMEDLGKLNLDYADFLEAYREANAGSTVGAGKKWAEYRNAFPLFKQDGEDIQLNSDRPGWQEYFSGLATPTASSPLEQQIQSQLPSGVKITGIVRKS